MTLQKVVSMTDDIEADLVINQQQGEEASPPINGFQETDEGYISQVEENKSKRGRPKEKTIEKDKVISYILKDIMKDLEYIHNTTFQKEIKQKTTHVGKKLEELAGLLGVLKQKR